jgi:hypothetical protein
MDKRTSELYAKAQASTDRVNSNSADLQNTLAYSFRSVERSRKALCKANRTTYSLLKPFRFPFR